MVACLQIRLFSLNFSNFFLLSSSWMVFLLFAWSPIIWDPNTGVGIQSLLQGVLPTQGSNLVLLHCKEATMEAYLIITATNLLLSLRVSPLLNMHRSFTPSSYHSFFLIIYLWIFLWKNMHNIGFTGGSVVKKKKICLPMQETQDMVLIPESGRSLGGGKDNQSSILAWKFSWTEEPCGL